MSRSAIVQLDLFSDLLDQNDLMRWNIDYERKGFAVWSVGDDRFSRHEGVSELRCISVIYDRNEGFDKIKSGMKWSVELKHYYYFHEIQTKGWGSSRTSQPRLKYRSRIHERKFQTREDSIAFAERLLSVMDRVKIQRENNQL